MRSLSLFPVLLGLLVSPASAQFREQEQPPSGFGVTADLVFEQMGGESLGDSIGSGFGAAAWGFYELPGIPVRVGPGVAYTRFATTGDGDAATKLSFHAQGSVLIADPYSAVVPYIQGKLGWASLDDDELFCTDLDTLACDPEDEVRGREWSGLELGAAVGVDIPMSETLLIDVSGTFTWLDLGDVTAGGTTISGTSTTASTFGIRGGVTFFFR